MSKPPTTEQHATALEMLGRAIDWLLEVQSDEGGWLSSTYGALRQGAATTSLVLYALTQAPKSLHEKLAKPLEAGFRFLKPGIAETKTIACPDGTFDYPTYAAAQTLTASRRLKGDFLTQEEQSLLASYLVQAQLDERRDFPPESPHHGGWDLLGTQLVKGLTSETNVSLAVYALEALAPIDTPEVKECRRKALHWARRTQNLPGDGGFAFSGNKDSLANKAFWLDREHMRPRSYGSATCDGLRCLLYAGESPDSESVRAAIAWLEAHPHAKVVTGFEDVKEETGWPEGLRFYYYAAVADCLHLCSDAFQESVRTDLLESLSKQQRDDGSWQNESARMREDDPLIATAFAATCLCRIFAQKSE